LCAYGGTATGNATAQYRRDLATARWNRYDERIDEYIGRHRRTYVLYATASSWTTDEFAANDWCDCVQPMIANLDPLVTVEFDLELQYSYADARAILIKRIKQLAALGDPYMKGVRVVASYHSPYIGNRAVTAQFPIYGL
jgi:hypothetical protein